MPLKCSHLGAGDHQLQGHNIQGHFGPWYGRKLISCGKALECLMSVQSRKDNRPILFSITPKLHRVSQAPIAGYLWILREKCLPWESPSGRRDPHPTHPSSCSSIPRRQTTQSCAPFIMELCAIPGGFAQPLMEKRASECKEGGDKPVCTSAPFIQF